MKKIGYLIICLAIGTFLLMGCSKKVVKGEKEAGKAGLVSSEGIEEGEIEEVQIGKSGGLKRIYFDFDKFNLTSEASDILKTNADWLKSNSSIKIQIEGHCDSRGGVQYNLALGEKRAQTAKKYLLSLGIKAERLNLISYGEEKPLDPTEGEDAWAKNRRAEFIITTK